VNKKLIHAIPPNAIQQMEQWKTMPKIRDSGKPDSLEDIESHEFFMDINKIMENLHRISIVIVNHESKTFERKELDAGVDRYWGRLFIPVHEIDDRKWMLSSNKVMTEFTEGLLDIESISLNYITNEEKLRVPTHWVVTVKE